MPEEGGIAATGLLIAYDTSTHCMPEIDATIAAISLSPPTVRKREFAGCAFSGVRGFAYQNLEITPVLRNACVRMRCRLAVVASRPADMVP